MIVKETDLPLRVLVRMAHPMLSSEPPYPLNKRSALSLGPLSERKTIARSSNAKPDRPHGNRRYKECYAAQPLVDRAPKRFWVSLLSNQPLNRPLNLSQTFNLPPQTPCGPDTLGP